MRAFLDACGKIRALVNTVTSIAVNNPAPAADGAVSAEAGATATAIAANNPAPAAVTAADGAISAEAAATITADSPDGPLSALIAEAAEANQSLFVDPSDSMLAQVQHWGVFDSTRTLLRVAGIHAKPAVRRHTSQAVSNDMSPQAYVVQCFVPSTLHDRASRNLRLYAGT